MSLVSRHFNQDVYERIQRDDMMQAAVRDSMLPTNRCRDKRHRSPKLRTSSGC